VGYGPSWEIHLLYDANLTELEKGKTKILGLGGFILAENQVGPRGIFEIDLSIRDLPYVLHASLRLRDSL